MRKKSAAGWPPTLFECAEADLVLADGKVSIVGRARASASAWASWRDSANPMRGAVARRDRARARSDAIFRAADAARLPTASTPSSSKSIRRRSMLEILKYVVVHDCGTVINPLILAGQIHGGVAQGIGNAFYEQLVFDDERASS